MSGLTKAQWQATAVALERQLSDVIAASESVAAECDRLRADRDQWEAESHRMTNVAHEREVRLNERDAEVAELRKQLTEWQQQTATLGDQFRREAALREADRKAAVEEADELSTRADAAELRTVELRRNLSKVIADRESELRDLQLAHEQRQDALMQAIVYQSRKLAS